MPRNVSRRTFLAQSAAGIGGALIAALVQSRAGALTRPPNIVLILVDDLGWRDLACYGGPVFETPIIDRLAADGMRFTNAYANCPVCSPSRAALLTGKYPARLQFTGHITAIDRHRHPEGSRILPPDDRLDLPLEEMTLAEALKPAGYVSASIGKWHVGHEGFYPENQGFDLNVGGWSRGNPPSYFYPYTGDAAWNPSIPTLHWGRPGEYLTDRLTDEAIHFVETNRDRPFFLYLTHYGVHTPLQAPEALVSKYEKKLAGRDTGIEPTYAAMVENLDMNTGRLLDTLSRLGLDDNTIVVFFSDNGGFLGSTTNAPLCNGKGTVYEGGIRVPLIVRWPGVIPKGTTSDEPVMGCDLYPTLLNIAGKDTQSGAPLDGIDLAPLWKGSEHLDRDALYWYYPHYVRNAPAAAVRMRDYKFIENYDPPDIELYNVAADPCETVNLAHEMPERAERMRESIRQHLMQVGAKLHTLNPDRRP